jgi:hypothetical protein
MRLADIGTQATWQGRQDATRIRRDEVTRQGASRQSDVAAAVQALKDEARATDDQRMKQQAFTIELAQQKVELAAAKLANATGEIAKKAAQFELNNAQKVLDAELASSAASTAATKAGTGKNGSKGLTPYQQTQAIARAHDAAEAFYTPPDDGNALTPAGTRLPYQDAMRRLTGKYGLTKAQAVDVLNTYYTEAGADGRPVFDFQERAQLQKLGYTKQQITNAMSGYVQSKKTGKPTPGYKLYEKMISRLG